MLTSQEKKQITDDLNKLDNIGDMFEYLDRKYELKKAKIGPISKPMYIKGCITAIEMFKPPKK